MENHPIPQDVTGFKFRLIGSMTVKQFLYVLAGGILACVSYVLPFSIGIRIPLVVFFGGLGAALAFVPIEGRPMDVMMINFLKTIPAENMYIYRKRGAEALIASYFTPSHVITALAQKEDTQSELEAKREILRNTLRLSRSYRPDEKDVATLSNISSYFGAPQTETPMTPPSPVQRSADAIPQGTVNKQPFRVEIQEEVDQKELDAEKKINEVLTQELSAKTEQPAPTPDMVVLKKKVPQTTPSEGARNVAGVTNEVDSAPASVTVQNVWQTTIQPRMSTQPSLTAPSKTEPKQEIGTPPQVTPKPVAKNSDASDEALRMALEEIQKIETSPAPIKIEPVKKIEESTIPQEKERPPSTHMGAGSSSQRATLTPPPPKPIQQEDRQEKSVASEYTNPVSKQIPPTQPSPIQEQPAPLAETSVVSPIQRSFQTIKPDESSHVHVVAAADQLKAGFPQLPDIPNIVLGIIKDPRGKVLPNILVEIMNNQGTPLRAFKTNALGQFTAATPLANGEYDVVLEDGRKINEFENIHITLDGTIFQPLEISSVDDREKLRRELFGGQQGPQLTQAA